MTRFLSFAGALLLMLACAFTAHATTLTLSGDTVRQNTTYLTGTYDVVASVYPKGSNTAIWSSATVPSVVFAVSYGQFSFDVDVPDTYRTASPGDYDIEIEVKLPAPASPIVLTPRMRLVDTATIYHEALFTW